MITGVVDNFACVVDVSVLGPADATVSVRAIVATGFDGYLTLDSGLVESLQLKPLGQRSAYLADGSEVVATQFIADVLWHGKTRRISVTEMDGGCLLGMRMLTGSRLSVEAAKGGEVRIELLRANAG